MARRFAALTLTSALLVTSCASSPGLRPSWVYAISRGFYGGKWSSEPANSSPSIRAGGGEAVGLVVILLLPFAVDTVLLPVTVPHDLLLVQ
jgi:hypothetical protein